MFHLALLGGFAVWTKKQTIITTLFQRDNVRFWPLSSYGLKVVCLYGLPVVKRPLPDVWWVLAGVKHAIGSHYSRWFLQGELFSAAFTQDS